MRRIALAVALPVFVCMAPHVARAQSASICPTFPNTHSSGCGALINITSTGATVTPVPGVGPYDGSDDTLIGVTNNIPACTGGSGTNQSVCGLSIYSLNLSSTLDIFGFDGDGIDTYGAPSNPLDNTGYGGPNANFTNPNAAQTAGTVNFVPPIPPGGTAYFSLENALTSSTACTSAINKSLCDVSGANCGATANPVPSITNDNTGRPTQIQATFIPQGIDPNTGQKYTLASAAAVCGFFGFDWQQTITTLPLPGPDDSFNAIATPTVVPTAPFNDPPPSGYVYMQTWGGPVDAPGLPVYYDPNNAAGTMSLSANTNTGANTLSFFDRPSDPCLPGGSLVNVPKANGGCGGVASPGQISFTTDLVGLQGALPGASVVDTGMGFTWTSNNNGTTGGVATTASDPNVPADPGGTGGVTVLSVNQTSTYSGVGVTGINGSSNVFTASSLLAAVLPASRSVQVNATATAFATIINAGAVTATGCSIVAPTSLPVTFVYQTTDPTTNAVTGTPNTPVNIAAGASQSFVIAVTPTATITPTALSFNFLCNNASPAPINVGLNTLLFSASTSPTPDVVALGATSSNDGIVHVPGAAGIGAFAVATVNLGSGDTITAGTNTGSATLPLAITICQTDPTSGQCLQPPATSVSTSIASNATPTFAIFAAASGAISFDPANSRLFVTFTDSTGAIRGETSVAVETQ